MCSYTANYHLFLQLVQVEPEPLGIPFPLIGTGDPFSSNWYRWGLYYRWSLFLRAQFLPFPLGTVGTRDSVVTDAASPSAVGVGGAGGH